MRAREKRPRTGRPLVGAEILRTAQLSGPSQECTASVLTVAVVHTLGLSSPGCLQMVMTTRVEVSGKPGSSSRVIKCCSGPTQTSEGL